MLELITLDPNYEIASTDDDNIVIVNGKAYPYFMTLSPEVDDEHCCKVLINGDFYYFG